jgi:2-phospho-L-lactate guanylyltransferase
MSARALEVLAVVPVKSLKGSKQRLAAALGTRREAFVRALLAQTLFALLGSERVSSVLVVTADPEVADEARHAGARVLLEDADLNTACARGLDEARSCAADVCMIIHADLALLSPRGVDALIRAYLERRARAESAIGLVRCKDGTGTNAVLLDPRLPFLPAFGPSSFQAHHSAAGSRAMELESHEVAFDVDTASDLEALAKFSI